MEKREPGLLKGEKRWKKNLKLVRKEGDLDS